MHERFPNDRFDAAPEGLKRIGSHREVGDQRPRTRIWWIALLATVVLIGTGIIAIAIQNKRIDFDQILPTGGQSQEPAESESPAEPEPESSAPETTPTPESSSEPGSSADAIDTSATVYVLNGTSRTGLSASATTQLAEKGWTQNLSVGNAAEKNVTSTVVYYHSPASASAARAMVASLGVGTAVESSKFAKNNAGVAAPANQLVVVLGTDYANRTR